MLINRLLVFSKVRSNSIKLSNARLNHIINDFNYSQRYLTTSRFKHTKIIKNEAEKMRIYIVQRYINYVKNYTLMLEKRFPSAVKMYRVFSVGIKEFLRDLKTYISLRFKVAKEQSFVNMTRQEIELYQKMPSDMYRIAPVLILSAIPFGNYIIFPLAFLKPRALLCSHFWSIQQKAEFSTQDLKERIQNNKPVFRALQAQVDNIPEGELKKKWIQILALLGSGTHPKAIDVLMCKDLFSLNGPYLLENMTYTHMGHLLKMHGLKKRLIKRRKLLKYRAVLLLEMDKAILREGGVDALNTEALRNVCHIRGLNSIHSSNQDMRDWLHEWLLISQNVDKSTSSLILHCPILFAYNHPQNWVLIYS